MALPAQEVMAGEPAAAGPVSDAAAGSPWAVAARQLTRDRVAIAAAVLFLLIAAVSFAAPLYAHYIAHTNPFQDNITGSTVVNGKTVPIVAQGGGALRLGEVPIGPTFRSHYFLGADSLGRDVMARVFYGGRTSLLIGIGSALICCVIAAALGLIGGFYGGLLDAGLSRLMDVLWAFPVYLLLISLSTVLLTSHNGIHLGFLQLQASSLLLPTLIIGITYVPYVYRPVRGQVLSVRQKDFITSAIAKGATDRRLMFSEIFPNVLSGVIVLFPLMVATTILTESALSFLSIGVQPPNASWGTIIDDGTSLLYVRPWVAVAPGIMITLTVLALNILGDRVQEALDPRAKLRAV